MPKARYTLTAEEVSEESVMLSGKIVKDVLGYRTSIEAEWNWIPAETLAKLVKLLRKGNFCEVTYQEIDGTSKTKKFKIAQPTPEVFTFAKDGTAVWKTVKLTMTAQEVDND